MLVKEKNYRKLFSHFWNLILIKITMSTKTTITIMWQLLKVSFQDKLEYVEQSEWTGVFLQKLKTNHSETWQNQIQEKGWNSSSILEGYSCCRFPQFMIQQWLDFHNSWFNNGWCSTEKWRSKEKNLFVFFSIICSWRVLIGQISTCLIILSWEKQWSDQIKLHFGL